MINTRFNYPPYQRTTENHEPQTYIGMTEHIDNNFKTLFRNPKTSFENPNCRSSTTLSKYIRDLKEEVTGPYTAFSAGGGVHFKLERTSCQQSLKYISLYNTKGASFSTVKKKHLFV